MGTRFLDALTGRAAAGVEVRLLYDDVGSRGLAPEALGPLRRAGGTVVAFNPLVRFWPRFAPRRRDHRKILVVDGRVAFTGGLNIGDEYARGIAGDGWRDTHVRVEGPAVRDLEAVFLESWFRADGPDVSWHDLLEGAPTRAGDARCAVLPDGPVYRRRRMRELLLSALEDAQAEVRLQSPYFAPGRRVLDSLSAASRRGVRVDLLLAGKTDHPVLRRAVRSILPKLLGCGVSVSEYEAAMMHAKVGVFDGVWATVGTSNLDRQSFEHSYEVNLIVEGGQVPEHLRACFERDRERSRALDLSTLAARSLRERALDRLAALVLWFV
jgi:cardiolipin synthase